MIRLERPEAAPAYLESDEVSRLRASVEHFFTRKEQSRRQERPDFPLFPQKMFARLLDDLMRLTHGKCAYCESPIKHPGNASLDRYRPKAGAVGLSGEFSTEHYWWLAYSWGNLYPACVKCNKFKGPKFPVSGDRARMGATSAELAAESRLLLDPFDDNPSLHLDFQDDGTVRPMSSEGEVTIATLELNRSDLVSGRKRVAQDVRRQLTGVKLALTDGEDYRWLVESLTRGRVKGVSSPILRRLFRLAGPTRPWSASALAVVVRFLPQSVGKTRTTHAKKPSGIELPATRKQAAATSPSFGSTAKQRKVSAKAQALRSRVVTRIAIHNFRGIRDLDISVDVEKGSGAPWTIFLGENGTGKSSILQAVALTLVESDADAPASPSPTRVLRKEQTRGWVRVWLDEAPEPRALEFSKRSRHFRRTGPSFPTVLLGYGATRLLPKAVAREKRGPVRLENMFDPFRPLIDANRWLGQLDKKSFDFVARALKDVLNLPGSARLRRLRSKGRPGVRLSLFGAELSLEELSDGYQSVLGLTCDIIAGLHVASEGALDAAEGLVAIDELGSHLHPRWRMRIVESMRKAFPRIQFIASTHDPLCLRGLEDGEAVVLRRTSKGRIFVVPELPPIKGLRVDQLLTSEYFGLDSTMDPTVEQMFRDLYRLLALRAPSNKQRERIKHLREELKPYNLPGETRRERRLFEIIDKELAQLDQQPDVQERQAIRQASDHMIADLNRIVSAKADA